MSKTIFRPMLAHDVDLKKLRYPVIGLPKYDGICGLIKNHILCGRSLKPIPNRYTREIFSQKLFEGIHGELICGKPNAKNVLQKTTSAIMSYDGKPNVTLYCFDDFTQLKSGYSFRYLYLFNRVRMIREMGFPIAIIPKRHIQNQDELLAFEEEVLEEGYEGIVIRDPRSPYKFGRSTVKEGGFLRLTRRSSHEGIILGLFEGQTNNNKKEIDERGFTKRSLKSKHMVPNGMIGAMELRDLKTKKHVRIGAGKMTAKDRKYYFEHQDEILGKIAKYESKDYGIKDKPRQATFQCFRNSIDL